MSTLNSIKQGYMPQVNSLDVDPKLQKYYKEVIEPASISMLMTFKDGKDWLCGSWGKTNENLALICVQDFSKEDLETTDEVLNYYKEYLKSSPEMLPNEISCLLPLESWDTVKFKPLINFIMGSRPDLEEKWLGSIEKWMMSYSLNELPYEVTKENPVLIRISGSDDASWSLSVNSMEFAGEVIDKLSREPTYDSITRLGFCFSN